MWCGSVAIAKAASGRPTLPTTGATRPPARSKAPISSTVVDLPLVPVTHTSGARASRAASASDKAEAAVGEHTAVLDAQCAAAVHADVEATGDTRRAEPIHCDCAGGAGITADAEMSCSTDRAAVFDVQCAAAMNANIQRAAIRPSRAYPGNGGCARRAGMVA